MRKVRHTIALQFPPANQNLRLPLYRAHHIDAMSPNARLRWPAAELLHARLVSSGSPVCLKKNIAAGQCGCYGGVALERWRRLRDIFLHKFELIRGAAPAVYMMWRRYLLSESRRSR